MHQLKTLAVVAAILLLGATVLVGTFYLSGNYLASKGPIGPIECKVTHTSYELDIHNNRFTTDNLEANLCDTLTVRNQDPETRLIAFGHHDHHKSYDGATEKLLKQGEGFTITLNESGTFTIHDHLHDEVEGTFTVGR